MKIRRRSGILGLLLAPFTSLVGLFKREPKLHPFDFSSDEPFSVSVWLRMPSGQSIGLPASRPISETTIVQDMLAEAAEPVVFAEPDRIDKDGWHVYSFKYDGSRPKAGTKIIYDGIDENGDVHLPTVGNYREHLERQAQLGEQPREVRVGDVPRDDAES